MAFSATFRAVLARNEISESYFMHLFIPASRALLFQIPLRIHITRGISVLTLSTPLSLSSRCNAHSKSGFGSQTRCDVGFFLRQLHAFFCLQIGQLHYPFPPPPLWIEFRRDCVNLASIYRNLPLKYICASLEEWFASLKGRNFRRFQESWTFIQITSMDEKDEEESFDDSRPFINAGKGFGEASSYFNFIRILT